MSYVITSSSQSDYDSRSIGYGLEQPATYHNFLSSPLEIEPDTEVAVSQVKIQRSGFVLVQDVGFAIYWGKTPARGEQIVLMSTQRPVFIQIKAGAYSQEHFAEEIETQLNNVLRSTYSHFDEANVTLSIDGTNKKFLGFNFELIQHGASSDSLTPNVWTPQIDEQTLNFFPDAEDFEWDPVTFTDDFTASGTTITASDTGGAGTICGTAIGTKFPVGRSNGICEFNIEGTQTTDGGGTKSATGFFIGLTRPNNTDVEFTIRDEEGEVRKTYNKIAYPVNFEEDKCEEGMRSKFGGNSNLNGTPQPFADFFVLYNKGESLKVGHAISEYDSSTGNVVKDSYTYREVRYFGAAGQIAELTDSDLQGHLMKAFRFTIVNENIVLQYIRKSDGVAVDIIPSGFANTGGRTYKPITMATDYLYPVIHLMTIPSSIEVSTAGAGAFKGNSKAHRENKYYRLRDYGMTSNNPTEADNTRSEPAGLQLARAQDIQIENSVLVTQFGSLGTTPSYTKAVLNGSDGLQYDWTFVFANSDPRYFSRGLTEYESSGFLTNSAKLLGFDGVIAQQTQKALGTSTLLATQFSSPNIPDTRATSTLFVRVSNLPISSFNGATNSISKILYCLPRFDNQGKTEGALYFEPNERLYVKMNNATKQIINDLKIELVDVNERVATDLQGNTIVCLHFRKSK